LTADPKVADTASNRLTGTLRIAIIGNPRVDALQAILADIRPLIRYSVRSRTLAALRSVGRLIGSAISGSGRARATG
jgi:hypothetical protein